MRKQLMGAVGFGALVGALALTGPAAADEHEAETEADQLSITVQASGDCLATITYTNNSDKTFWGDYRLDGEEGTPDSELAPLPEDPTDFGDSHDHGVAPDTEPSGQPGETFGLQYNPVLLPAGEAVSVDVAVETETSVQARIWRGSETDWYVPWTDPFHVKCSAAQEPTTEPTTDPTGEPTDPPAGGEGGEADEQLPVTGTSTPLIAGGAVLLLALGGGLYLLSRKRRVTFES